ncbi:MAG: multiubiquitin domain-containing protein [Prolixibacteraceae bacterium]
MSSIEKSFEEFRGQEEIIDIELCTKENRIPSEGKWYRIKIGDDYYIFLKQFVSGEEILEKVGVTSTDCFWLYQKLKNHDFERISLTEKVNLAQPGIEHFVVKPTEVFNYFVDNEPEMTDKKELTPNQILEAAGITPVSDYYLVRINVDGTQESFANSPNQPIKMVCPSMKFVSVFRGEVPVS